MTATFYVGDAVQVMGTLPEKSVDLVLSSPPFLALRSYLPADHPDKALEGGSQATPGEFIDWLLDVVEACDRVLAPHGSLCFELGDTYADSGGPGGDYNKGGLREGQPKWVRPQKHHEGNKSIEDGAGGGGRPRPVGPGWAMAKSLSLVPESFRWAMVYGHNPFTGRTTAPWRLRNVIRWVRPNPPVGALGDKFRPATSELMVFCKSAKRYFDLDAVREAPSAWVQKYGNGKYVANERKIVADRADKGQRNHEGNPAGAPPLDWWNIPPGGYPGSHYAVFPPELCVKPIKAMCPEKVCRVCGEPSRRLAVMGSVNVTPNGVARYIPSSNVTPGFKDCSHDDWRPGLVLDPFAGSGTTLAVATGHGRDAIGIDLDERNYELALDRVGPLVLSKGEVAA